MSDTGRRVVIRGAGLACLGLAALSLLARGFPGFASLPSAHLPGAAAGICLAIAGLSITALGFDLRRSGGSLGSLLVVIAAAGLAHQATAGDRLAFPEPLGDVLAPLAGVGANTLVALALLGLALALQLTSRWRFLAGLLSLGVLTVGAVGAVGHLIDVPAAYAWGAGGPVEPLTAFALVLSGLAALGLTSEREEPANIAMTWGLPLAAMLLAVLAGVFFRQSLLDRQRERAHQAVAATAARVRAELEAELQHVFRGLDGLMRRGVALGWTEAGDWSAGAELALASAVGYEGLLLSGFPAGSGPAAPSSAILQRAGDSGRLAATRQQARSTGRVAVAALVDLPGRGSEIAVVQPVLGAGQPVGATITALFTTQEMMGDLGRFTGPGYRLAVAADGRTLYGDPALASRERSWIAVESLRLPGPGDWRVTVVPREQVLREHLGGMPDALLAASLLIALLVATTMRFGIEARQRARQSERAVAERTEELQSTVAALEERNREREQSQALLQRLQEVTLMLAGQLEPPSVVRTVVEAAAQLTDARWAAFFTPDVLDGAGPVQPYATAGKDASEMIGAVTGSAELLSVTLQEGRSIRSDLRRDRRVQADDAAPASYLAIPVRGRDQRVSGALVLADPRPGCLEGRSEEVARQLATHAALALDTAHLLEAERSARTEAQEASAAKDRFLRILGHELRNPLGSIRSALHVLDEEPGEPRREERMRQILRRQVRHLTELVDDLLDISRIADGRISIRPEPLELSELLRERIDGHRPTVREAELDLHLELPPESAWVDADPTRMAQVVDNLLSNAVRYTGPGGSIHVGLDLAPDTVTLRVRDSGKGIDPAERDRIFEPFTQAVADTDSGGLGIGLSLVSGLVEAHGGDLGVESEGPDEGSEFWVRLPRREAPGGAAADRVADRREAAGRRVLLVEDHADAAASLAEILQGRGHDVRVAPDGLSGVEAFREFAPDAVICDINLPDIDGFEVIRRLRATDAGRDARIVALTGYGDEETLERCREAGFDDHLLKPVDPRQLLEMLRAP